MRILFSVPSLRVAPVVLLYSTLCFAQQVPVGPPPTLQQSSPQNSDADKGKDKKPEPSAGGAAVDSSTYKIGPSDVLRILVWNEEKFSGIYTVHQDGKITMPLVGDIAAGDTTPHEVEGAVAKALTKFVVKPLVTVTVQDVQSKKYYLDGLVNHPGEYPLSAPTTILEAISKAGGLQDFANKKKIYILRGTNKLPFNLKDVMNGKNMDQNIKLEPGDHIVVP